MGLFVSYLGCASSAVHVTIISSELRFISTAETAPFYLVTFQGGGDIGLFITVIPKVL